MNGLRDMLGAEHLSAIVAGPATAAASHEAEEEEAAEEVHEAAADLLYLRILRHVADVVFESRRQKRSLVLAMLSGHR